MIDRGRLLIPSDTSTNQALASDPDLSIWVEANAGSGKTFVLTHRVLRLLLAGVKPQSILCLTYTKAAAAEMRKRVGGRLAQWAVADEADLRDDLQKLTGREPTAKRLEDARTLFARALETPGGLRILTIHAFCEAVLHRFPIEAGVPFDFAVIEEDQQDNMLLMARESVLAEGLRGGANAEAVETLFGLLSDHAITEAIGAALGAGARLKPVLADIAGAKARLRALVGFEGASPEEISRQILSDTLLTPDTLRLVVTRLNGDPQGNTRCADLLARLDPDRPDVEGLRAAFFTGKGDPRARLMLKKEIETFPELHELLQAEQERLIGLEAALAEALLVARSEAVLDVVAAIAARYEAEKRRHALLDFDDLIEKLGDLFANAALGPWVQYKLDAGIDHILVDESQDTNEQQWRVVKALAEEFFTGAGAVARPRSIFAVGDQKQSIYSFQGAQPALFGETGLDMARRAGGVEKPFRHVKLHTSFRTLKGILDAVDRVCDRADIQKALLSGDKIVHQPARVQPGGSVTLWPPIQDEKSARDDSGWPTEPVEAEQSANRRIALRIAKEIRGWIDAGRLLGERNRPIVADDVLILLQKRGPLFQEIIRALRGEKLPTPGADRLAVTGHIAVLDLLALIDVLLNPADDLQLAALLRSPLFDLSEDDLFALAHPRLPGQTLWSALSGSDAPAPMAAAERLGRWRAALDMERPFEFLAGVLYAEGGLKRFHARLGTEVDDVLSELLDLALSHEQGSQPSLQGFAAEMRRRTVTIKRELAEAGGGVRVMTVHGAKGLEAPIVILADATGKPSAQQTGKPVYVLDKAPGPLLFHASSKGQHVPQTALERQGVDDTLNEEYWRRLYVAMTRAEDELYVIGPLGSASKPETQLAGSWYDAIESGLGEAALPVSDAAGEIVARVFPAPMQADFRTSPPPVPADHADLALGAVAAPEIIGVVQPSYAAEQTERRRALETKAEAARDGETARREGLALHALLQHLTRIDPNQWAQVAPRALEALLPESKSGHAPLIDKAIAILSDPGLVHLFGPNSRAELPFRLQANQRGKLVWLSGRIDRVVVDDSGVLVVDYKSDATVPQSAADVPRNYLTQLGLYALVAGQLFPGRPIRAAILWTALESLMNLPDGLLETARSDFTLR
ncbi:double-strand break repair helicase AddA [Devosia sp. XJ19-1]|uniref:DNA 3'-5' helicase n=1 Tax=Devosia ureilytica TaxID=2952754 RepID=A0A9Q4AMU7_9HYPH|nr:double-strand break repair helicase AddA [Devosia ureilytica]MCP8883057.1 double-strand break repair helicase AddA [Devosia ureilytica]MCP8886575.1 double-strand break repair helicase AddA [Devosia ureilytica]